MVVQPLFRRSHADAWVGRDRRLPVLLEQPRVLEELGHPHVLGGEILEEPLAVHLHVGVQVEVEGPGQDHEVPAVDDPLGLAREVLADVDDRTSAECDVRVAEIRVAVLPRVVGDDPVGVPDECRPGHVVLSSRPVSWWSRALAPSRATGATAPIGSGV